MSIAVAADVLLLYRIDVLREKKKDQSRIFCKCGGMLMCSSSAYENFN